MGLKTKIEIKVALIGLGATVIGALIPLFWNKLFDGAHSDARMITYQGYVRDKITKMPIPDAIVSFLDNPTLTPKSTDSRGIFSIDLNYAGANQTIRLQVERDGYRSWNNYRLLTAKPEVEEILLEAKAIEHTSVVNTLINSQDKRHLEDVKKEQRKDESFVSGYVIDLLGNKLEDVEVSIIGSSEREVTNSNGEFNLKANCDEPRIVASKNGYASWNDYIKAPKSGLIITLRNN